jgi:hypothetical protein
MEAELGRGEWRARNSRRWRAQESWAGPHTGLGRMASLSLSSPHLTSGSLFLVTCSSLLLLVQGERHLSKHFLPWPIRRSPRSLFPVFVR